MINTQQRVVSQSLKFGFVVAVLLLLALAVLTLHAQENSLPAPTGPYPVGVIETQWMDDSRPEPFTNDPDDARAVTVALWYPANDASEADPSPYVPDLEAVQAGLALEIQWYQGDVEATIATITSFERHALHNAEAVANEAQYPVVVFSNILSGIPGFHTLQVEELASHGYVVVEIIHTYGMEVIPTEQPQIGDVTFAFSDLELTLVEDVFFVLDRLETLNMAGMDEDSPVATLQGKLDLDHIGIIGWSAGSGIALRALQQDERLIAGIAQDGASFTLAPEDYGDIAQPVMLMQSNPWLQEYYDGLGGPAYLVMLNGIGHGSFTDMVLWPREEKAEAVFGTIEDTRAVEIINAYVVAFLDHYLKGEGSPLLQGETSAYPEVELDSTNLLEE